MQAVMASDFAIFQFRFLTVCCLCMDIGHILEYARLCQRYYDDWFQSLYNVIFTSLPVICLDFLRRMSVHPFQKILYHFVAISSSSAQNSSGKIFGIWDIDSVQRWFFPYNYQIVQDIHKHEAGDGRTQMLEMEIGNQLTPEEARSLAIAQLPREISKHTGFAFDSPGYESFFASQFSIYAPQKAWDVARRASMRSKPKIGKRN
ncbi:hypothetical protein QYF36_026545 [Acer negundo]|nr:hypothetical protein QYF36_026545 [Acer negundo]